VDTIRIAIQLDDWKTVYHSFSDAFREQCAEDDFVAGAAQRGASFKVMANLKAGEVVVDGDNATAEIILSGAEQNAGEWPFVREGGEWHLPERRGHPGLRLRHAHTDDAAGRYALIIEKRGSPVGALSLWRGSRAAGGRGTFLNLYDFGRPRIVFDVLCCSSGVGFAGE
jgi:hypothetical protein